MLTINRIYVNRFINSKLSYSEAKQVVVCGDFAHVRRLHNRGGGKPSLGETGIVLPTPVAFFAIKRVQVLAKMSKKPEIRTIPVSLLSQYWTQVFAYIVFSRLIPIYLFVILS